MSEDSVKRYPHLEFALRLDEASERFERCWKCGERPDIQSVLDEFPEAHWLEVFRDLLAIELEHRFRWGEVPMVEEYLARYPQFGAQIEAALPENQGQAKTADGAPTESFVRAGSALHIRCPDCQHPIAIVDAQPIQERRCPKCGSSLAPTSRVARGAFQAGGRGERVAHFELIEQIGEGSFGSVWKAKDTKTDRVVALKMPRMSELTTAELDRFIGEAQSAARCQHPGVVTVYEIGFEGDLFFISSQYIEGESLRQYLDRFPEHRLPSKEAAALCIRVAEALHHAHEMGVVHRDLKPANILLDAAGNPYVTDFGLAKRETSEVSVTMSNMIMGTVQYMSPEQARGDSKLADRRSDIYSLGTILFELLTGERPFRGTTETLLRQVQEDDPPSVCKLNPQVHRDLEAICLRGCLEKAPEKRFNTALELADDLQRYLDGKPTRSRPITRPERAWRWCKRNPVVASFGTISLALIFALLVGATVWAARETALRQRADLESARARAAERETKLHLAEASYQAARLAGERGQWQLAVEKLDQALAAGHPDPVLIRLGRIKAFDALDDLQRWSKEIVAVSQMDDLGTHRAEVVLWQGQRLRMLGQENAGFEMIQRALDMSSPGLPPADAAYASAILADTSPKTVEYLRKALAEDPFHHAAMAELACLLCLMGNHTEAWELAATGEMVFPQDFEFSCIKAMVAALRGDRAAVDRCLEESRQRFGGEMVRQAKPLLDLIFSIQELDVMQPEAVALGKLLWNAGSLMSQRAAALVVDDEFNGRGSARMFPTRPRSLMLAWVPLQELASPSAGSLTTIVASFLRQDNRVWIDAIERAIAIHPEGTLIFLRGIYLMKDQRLREAAEAFAQAGETPCLLPLVSRHAYLGAATAAHEQYMKTREQADIIRAVGYVRKQMERGITTPVQAWQCFMVAFEAKEFGLARQLADDLIKCDPDKHMNRVMKAKAELGARDYIAAMATAEDIFTHAQNEDQRKAANTIKQQARDGLRKYLKAIDESGVSTPIEVEPKDNAAVESAAVTETSP